MDKILENLSEPVKTIIDVIGAFVAVTVLLTKLLPALSAGLSAWWAWIRIRDHYKHKREGTTPPSKD